MTVSKVFYKFVDGGFGRSVAGRKANPSPE